MSDPREQGPPSVDPAKVKRLVGALVAVCVALMVADVFILSTKKAHAHFAFEGWIGFHAGFAFLSSVVLMGGAAWLRKLLLRGADYYGDGPEGEDE